MPRLLQGQAEGKDSNLSVKLFFVCLFNVSITPLIFASQYSFCMILFFKDNP